MADFHYGFVLHTLVKWFPRCRDLHFVPRLKWHFRARIQFSDEVESLKLEYCSVQTVLYSAFIHQESVENPCICEILYGQTTQSQMGSGGGRASLRLVLVFEKQGLGEFC